MKKALISALCAHICLSQAIAHDRNLTSKADDHGPIGVMGEHNHKEGEWMLSYRYSTMRMEGNRDGTNAVSDQEIASQGYMVAPQDMRMEMHMLGVMYGWNDRLTLMAMLPYKELTMDHKFVAGMHNGKSFRMSSEGVADIKLSGIYTLKSWGENRIYANFGVSLPTGSTDEMGRNSVTGAYSKLPYPMQIGAGTYALLPGLTYTGHNANWSWGAQALSTLQLGKNSDEYRLGNHYEVSAWGARNINHWLSTSFRINAHAWGDIHGEDPELSVMTPAPTFRTDLRGGERIDALLGVNFIVPNGTLKGNRLALEFGMPIYQDLDGPQLEVDYRLMLGWQKAF